jgi:hypothetical protein
MHRSKAPVTSSPPSLTLSPRPLCAVCSFLFPPRPTPISSYFNKEAIQIIAKIAVAAGNLTPAPPPPRPTPRETRNTDKDRAVHLVSARSVIV